MKADFLITSIERIVYVGQNEYPEQHLKFRSNLQANELIFHITGKSTVYFHDQTLHTEPNSIRFLPKGNFSRYEVEHSPGSACFLIVFQTDHTISENAFVKTVQKSSKVGSLFKKIFSIWVAKDEGYYFECLSLLYRIFAEMQKNTYISQKQYEKIEPAVGYVRENFMHNDFRSKDLQEICGVSYSYIKRIFLLKFGMTPKQYVIQMRINYACDLLSERQYNVGQIADLCGYSDIYFFSKQFKSYMGITPSEYIKKYVSSK